MNPRKDPPVPIAFPPCDPDLERFARYLHAKGLLDPADPVSDVIALVANPDEWIDRSSLNAEAYTEWLGSMEAIPF